MTAISYIERSIKEIIKGLYTLGEVDFKVERPPEGAGADFAVNAPFILAKPLRKPPAVIGGEMAQSLQTFDYIEKAENVRGYLNITLKDGFYKDQLDGLLAAGDGFFRNDAGSGKKINLEFVSANPVGPLNIVSGRAGAYGDSLAKLLGYCGYNVHKEFYVNDFGRQMHLFALSVEARYMELFGKAAEIPQDGYMGAYVKDIAEKIKAESGDKWLNAKQEDRYAFIRKFSLEYVLGWQKRTLEQYGVVFDRWFYEASLHDGGYVEAAFKIIKDKGLFYEQEGALWFRTTGFGDEKDRVVKKKDGDYTYLASDIAYMYDKKKRGFDYVFDILGPDHHGYVARLEAVMQALGYPKSDLTVLILQQVNLLNEGEKMKMSKREGNFVSLDELISSVGADAARYYFIMRNYNSHLDFDIALATERTEKNPVYYVQYAYARVCNIFRFAEQNGIDAEKIDIGKVSLGGLEKEERELMLAIAGMPDAIKEAGLKYQPSVLVQHTHNLVSLFHTFYAKHRVVTDDQTATVRRLYLMKALKKTLFTAFKLIGISAPESM